jgi:putative ABC transport system permease protein
VSADRVAPEATGDGGGAARRAVVRWAVRMLRREWRQQLLVLLLLTLAVAAAIGFASAAYNLAPVSGNAEFGTANHWLGLDGDDPDALQADVAAAEAWFGTIDVIGHRDVSVPGRFEPVDYRAQDPRGAYSSPMLALRAGRYPTAAGEAAVTDAVAEEFGLDVGAPVALDGTTRTVVGVIENPSDLSDEFVLLRPGLDPAQDKVRVLVDASSERVRDFRPPGGGAREISERGTINEGVFAAVGVLGVATVALLLVALLAAAGFVVVAQRRLRQLGMLAAVGATERHLRLAMVANGAAVGIVAAVAGAALAFLGWIGAEPRLETALGRRIDRSNLPWWLIATGMLLALLTATGAAWWPARVVARTSIVGALSGRPARPRPVHRSAALAGALIAAGVACLVVAGDVADDTAVRWTNVLLIAAGTLATVVGVLLISPLAIRTLAPCAALLPVAGRLALRDLARFQARSGAALAAISLVLGIPVAIVVTATAAEHAADKGNLADNQLLIRDAEADGPFVPEPAELDRLQAQVDRVVAAFDDPTVVPIDVAIDPNLEPDPEFGRPAVSLGERVDDGWRDKSLVYVATAELLEPYGVDLDSLEPDTEFITTETGELDILGVSQAPGSNERRAETVTNVERIAPGYTSLPGSFITPDALRRRGWETVGSGRWLVQTNRPPTAEQLAAARDVAAGAGLTIETRDDQKGLARLRSGATAVGVILALGVLAMTIGLIRSETAGDLRTLTATGATSTTRRALTAATAGALAALGVALGTAGALAILTAGYLDDTGTLSRVPVLYVLVITIGTPVAAALAGWTLAGREPRAISRQAMT